MIRNLIRNHCFSALLGVLSLSLAQAGDPSSTYNQALELWKARAHPAKIEEMISLLSSSKKGVGDSDLAYKIHILLARGYYWRATQGNQREQKLSDYLKSISVANEARAISDDYAEAYYFAAISRGRWGEINGITSSLRYVGEVKENCQKAIERITMEGESGVTVEGYGPDRTLGRLNMKLPSFAGGSMEAAREHLERAFKNGITFANNTVFYADFLSGGNANDRAKAKRILDELLAKDPASINPDRLPEMQSEFQEARELRRRLQ
jgi:tetratricopeptide (TPR) repeat protein